MTKLAVEPRGTPLAGVAPTLAHGGAAQLPRAHDTLKIRQALTVLHFRVTRPGSVIRFASPARVSIDARATIWTDASPLVQARLSTDWLVAKFALVSATALTLAIDAVAIYAVHPASTGLAPVQRVTGLVRGRGFGLTAGAGRSHGATLAQANVRPYASAQWAASSHAYRNYAEAGLGLLSPAGATVILVS